MITQISGVNLGQKRSRNFTYVVLMIFSVCYIGVFYSYQVEISTAETSVSIDEFVDSQRQCQAIFTITPRLPLDKNNKAAYISLLEPLKERFLHYIGSRKFDNTTSREEEDLKGLDKALRYLAEASPNVGTEFYETIAEYLPALLISTAHLSMKDNASNCYDDVNKYADGIIASKNTTKYWELYMNKTGGFVPRPRKVSELPTNPFSYGSPQREPLESISENFDVLPYSRLTFNKGNLPHIPCKLRFYSLNDVQQCTALRASRNVSTWIGFIGDSKMRERFEYIIDATSDLQWSLQAPGKVVSWEMFNKLWRPQRIQVSMKAWNPIGFNISIVWASRGPLTDTFAGPMPVLSLKQWMSKKNEIPDLLIIAFGPWIYRKVFSQGLATLTAPDLIIKRWNTMKKIVARLAKRTKVLLLLQSRYRTMNVKTVKPYNDSGHALLAHINYVLGQELYFDHATDWTDKVMITLAKDTGAVIWDTSLPLNLASIRECGILKQSHQEKHPAYIDRLLCTDTHHPAPPTMHDEMMMLLNYLCNADLKHEEYCCGAQT